MKKLIAYSMLLALMGPAAFAGNVRCEVAASSEDQAKALTDAILKAKLKGPAESRAFTRAGVLLEGLFKPMIDTKDGRVSLYKPSGEPRTLDGIDYVEFPNSTAMTTVDPTTGLTREFMLTRGVKKYKTNFNTATGKIGPKGYVSDVLLFEKVGDEAVYRGRLLASKEADGFFFEDPRISVLHDEAGHPTYILSGTDYSSHVPGFAGLDVMNRFVELKIDGKGLPQPVALNAETGRPDFENLSPAPHFNQTTGKWEFVDAKNATIAINADHQIVVRTRMRPDFTDSRIKQMADGDEWHYAEQVFVFQDWAHFKSYDWDDALVDLFGKRGSQPTKGNSAPLISKVVLRDKDLKEHMSSDASDVQIYEPNGKGLGPGTRPIPIRRSGSQLYIADGVGGVEHSIGKMPRGLENFPIKDGDTIFITFDHEIRYFRQNVGQQRLIRRHYSASIKVWDRSLTNMIDYRPDVIQPLTEHERGLFSGILDLQHVYPMGWTIFMKDGRAMVRVYCGAADAHTTIYDFDMLTLLLEGKH